MIPREDKWLQATWAPSMHWTVPGNHHARVPHPIVRSDLPPQVPSFHHDDGDGSGRQQPRATRAQQVCPEVSNLHERLRLY